ncbi:MAG TPA: TadE/TadG family type IV pilus assembly protein [Sphingomicrobium sp.]|nr:TadE/TadG family type IV pilus assembly protein [Sphingomicrobium sp.]
MTGILFFLKRDMRGSAAVEMVLSLPILLVLIFGSLELGNYFLTEHKVVKAVRDGARYAARQPFSEYPGCSPSATVVDETRNVTMTGQVATGGTPKLGYWTDPNSVDVTAACDSSPGGTYSGIYEDPTAPGVPVVTVSASVPYTPVVGQLGLTSTTLTLSATQESPVTGI